MGQGSRAILASTKFVPVANPGPVVNAYMRNTTGTVSAGVPATIGVGHWRFTIPDDIDRKTTSITAAAATAAGLFRNVSVVITPGGGLVPSIVDVFVRDDGGAVQDDAAFVEVTLTRMPHPEREVLASVIFTPTGGAAVSVFNAINCAGNAASDAPARIGAGHYRTFVPTALLRQGVSITKHATNAGGANRLVSVVLSAPVGNSTQVDIFINTDAAGASDDALFVECTIQRLPL